MGWISRDRLFTYITYMNEYVGGLVVKLEGGKGGGGGRSLEGLEGSGRYESLSRSSKQQVVKYGEAANRKSESPPMWTWRLGWHWEPGVRV